MPRIKIAPARPLGGPAVLACTLILALATLATPARAQTPSASAKTPLDPTSAAADVRLAIEIRPATALKSPEFKRLTDAMPTDQLPPEAKAILSGAIEQVILLVAERPDVPRTPDAPPPFVVLLRSGQPYDWKTFISGRVEDVRKNGVAYRRSEGGTTPTCFRVLDDRTLLIAAEADIIDPPLGGSRPKAKHGWDDAWRKLKPSVLRVAIDGPWVARQLRESRGKDKTPTGELLGTVIDKTLAYSLALDGASKMNLDVLASTADEVDGKRVVDALRSLLAMGREALPNLRQAASASGRAMDPAAMKILDQLDAVVATARVDQTRATARFHVEAPGVMVPVATALLLPAVQAAREAARRTVSINNLKRIGLAMIKYEAATGTLPPAAPVGPDGKTPHSWRVELLPYLGEESLFKEYKLDEPWDSPSNRKLVERMPAVFRDPSHTVKPGGTSYFVATGPDSAFPPRPEGTKLAAIADGTGATILVVDARRDVPWTRPEDIPLGAADQPPPRFGGWHPGGFVALFADGTVRFIRQATDPAALRGLLTPSGGEVIPPAVFGPAPAGISPPGTTGR